MNTIVGMGEALWDVLPEGKKIGGAPANFAYHVSQFGFDSRVVSAVGRDADGQEILDRRPRRGGNYRNTADIFGNLPLIVRIKKSLRCKLFLHLLKGKLQGTHADRLQKFAVQLILPRPFVQRNMPV